MKRIISTTLVIVALFSCSNDKFIGEADLSNQVKLSQRIEEKDVLKREFISALSRTISTNSEVFDVLRKESLKSFDNNTDVLYHMIKDHKLSDGRTISNVISENFTKERKLFERFEFENPLLNIFVPNLDLISKDLSVDKWSNSGDVGVAYSYNNKNILLVEGEKVAIIEKGEFPSIPVFYIGENRRVQVKDSFRSAKGQVKFSYEFLDPAYENKGSLDEFRNVCIEEPDKYNNLSPSELDVELISIFRNTNITKSYFNQRAYIYYSDNGNLNKRFNEYLYRFKINPNAYYDITDVKANTDPRVKDDVVHYYYGDDDIFVETLIDRLWTKGAYTFRFEVITPHRDGNSYNQTFNVSVYPKDLFIMNAERVRRHPTWFRHTRWTYRLKPTSFKSRWVYPHKIGAGYLRVEGAWDVSKFGLTKSIRVYEVDKGKSISETFTTSSEFLVGSKISAGIKVNDVLNLGLEANANMKESKSYSVTYTYQDNDDFIGTVNLSFDDPILIEGLGEDCCDEDPHYAYKTKDISAGNMMMSFVPLKNR